MLNNQEILTGVADTDIEYVEFDQEITEGAAQRLVIQLLNKDNSDTVQNEDKTEIVKDMLLHIKSIEIDEIALGNLTREKSQYQPYDSQFPVLDNCVDLGWNGDWILDFESPFYIWLLENI